MMRERENCPDDDSRQSVLKPAFRAVPVPANFVSDQIHSHADLARGANF